MNRRACTTGAHSLSGPTARQRGSAVTMMRAAAFAALLGAGVAASALYMLAGSAQRVSVIGKPALNAAASNALIDIESWPICTTMGALTDGPAWAPLDPDFAAGKQALAANDWNGAIKALGSAALRDTAMPISRTISDTLIDVCGSSSRRSGIIGWRWCSIPDTDPRMNISAKQVWSSGISPTPRSTSLRRSEFV